MGSMSIWHWLIVLLVIVLLFGAKKIPELAKGLGSGIKTFKKEMEDDEKKPQENVTQTQSPQGEKKPEFIEAQVVEADVVKTQVKQSEKV